MPINAVAELVVDLFSATRARRAGQARARPRPRAPGRLVRAGARRRGRRLERGPRAHPSPPRFQLPLVELPFHGRRPGRVRRRCRCTCSSAWSRSRSRSPTTSRSASPSPTRRTSTRSTSSGSRRASRSSSASPPARTSSAEVRRLVRQSEAFGARSALLEEHREHSGRGGGRRPRGRRRCLGRPARPPGQPGHLPGRGGRRHATSTSSRTEDSLVVASARRRTAPGAPGSERVLPGVTTRLKVLANLDIAERRQPQDGRIALVADAAGRCSTSASPRCRRSTAS